MVKRTISQVTVSQANGPYKRRRYVAKKAKKRSGPSTRKQIATISKEPFPSEWRTSLTWDPACLLLAPGAQNGAAYCSLNNLYDPDAAGNWFSNGQPLFFDQILSATGPYQKFRVNGWKAKIVLCNASTAGGGSSGAVAVDCIVNQGAVSTTDIDTYTELASTPGRRRVFLSPRDGSQSMQTIYMNGKLKDFVKPTENDDDYCGTYNTSPANLLYLSIGAANAYTTDVTGLLQLYIKVIIQFDVTLYARDGVTS